MIFKLLILSFLLFQNLSDKSLLNQYKNLISFYSEFEFESGEFGKITYLKDKKYRIELGKSIIIIKENEIYNYSPDQKRCVITKAESNFSVFDFYKMITETDKFFSEIEEIGTDEGYVIKLTGKKKELGIESTDIFFDKSKRLKKIIVYNSNQAKTIVNISKFITNPKIDKNSFSVNFPKDTQIIDFR